MKAHEALAIAKQAKADKQKALEDACDSILREIYKRIDDASRNEKTQIVLGASDLGWETIGNKLADFGVPGSPLNDVGEHVLNILQHKDHYAIEKRQYSIVIDWSEAAQPSARVGRPYNE